MFDKLKKLFIINNNNKEKNLINKKKKKKFLPLRTALNYEILLEFFEFLDKKYQTSNKILKKKKLLLAYNLLFQFGLRIDEIRFFTFENLTDLLNKKSLLVNLSKNNKPIKKWLTFDFINLDLKTKNKDLIYFSQKKYLFENPKTNLPYSRSYFNKFLNKNLNEFSKIKNLNLKSHSFRINFITSNFQNNVPIEKIRQLIGHSNINTTIKYNRYDFNTFEEVEKISLNLIKLKKNKKK